MDKEKGRIGTCGETAYYLLYKPTPKSDWALDNEFLDKIAARDAKRRLVVYCEKIWVHREMLREWEHEHRKEVRPMLVPFNLK